MGRTYTGISPYLLKIGNKHILTVRERCGIEPGTCIIARSVARLKIFIFIYTQIDRRTLSIEAHVLPVQINTALN
jgi:hypothetical protein